MHVQLHVLYTQVIAQFLMSGNGHTISLYMHTHLKSYDPQYQLCANVIRELCCNHSPDDNFEDMILTISCD